MKEGSILKKAALPLVDLVAAILFKVSLDLHEYRNVKDACCDKFDHGEDPDKTREAHGYQCDALRPVAVCIPVIRELKTAYSNRSR